MLSFCMKYHLASFLPFDFTNIAGEHGIYVNLNVDLQITLLNRFVITFWTLYCIFCNITIFPRSVFPRTLSFYLPRLCIMMFFHVIEYVIMGALTSLAFIIGMLSFEMFLFLFCLCLAEYEYLLYGRIYTRFLSTFRATKNTNISRAHMSISHMIP